MATQIGVEINRNPAAEIAAINCPNPGYPLSWRPYTLNPAKAISTTATAVSRKAATIDALQPIYALVADDFLR